VIFNAKPMRRTLLAELQLAIYVPAHKSRSSVETHVLIDAAQDCGRLTLFVTNLDEYLVTSFPSRIEVSGRIALPTRKLYEYVRLLPDGEISITADETNAIVVKAGRSTTRFTGISPQTFPNIPEVLPPQFELDPSVFQAVISKTKFAMSDKDNRFLLSCLLISTGPGKTRAVSTDGNRLAFIEMPESLHASLEILIPRTAIEPLTHFVSNAGDRPIGVTPEDKYVAFSVGNRSLLVRRLVGRFPNYGAALKIGQGREVVVPRKLLAEAIQHTMQFADKRRGTIRVRVEDNQVLLSSACAEFGEAKAAIPTLVQDSIFCELSG
jgi:DNA polymerase-3 subunit beta